MSLGLKLETCEILLSYAIVYRRPPSCFYCGGCCGHVLPSLPCTLAVDMRTSWLVCVVICPKFDPNDTSKSGEKPYLEVFSRFGLWRDFLNDNIQVTISAFRLIKNMSINPTSVEFHQCHAKPHSICFLSQYQRERKKSLPRLVDN